MPIHPDQTSFTVMGAMSGSSLDGLDLALVCFDRKELGWRYAVLATDTLQYNAAFANRFTAAMHGTALSLVQLDRDLGEFIGQSAAQLAVGHEVDLIASHGHTIFHDPSQQLTHQIGAGANIAAVTGIDTVSDLRSVDVALGGQGAPLVPIGEASLYPKHKAFLNLGGIANVSIHAKNILAYDICTCNQVLDYLAQERGMRYDNEGAMAAAGMLNEPLLRALNALPFHQQAPPKSLGREWFEEYIRPLVVEANLSVEDKLNTLVEHIAVQIGLELNSAGKQEVLCTGGGAFNKYLMQRIQANTAAILDIPDKQTVAYKEAIIFAFLGLLRVLGHPNTLASVTGAPVDSIGGCLYLGPSTTTG